jgi:hypothetical protein
MEQHLYGRLTTLNKLKDMRDNPEIHPHHREGAAKAMERIKTQLKDKKLMKLRERLIKATIAGDLHESWKIENQIKAHEGKELEKHE